MGWLSLTYTCVRTRACACGVTYVTRAGTDRITRRYVAKCYTYRQTAQDVSESTFVVGRLMYRVFRYRAVYVKWCDSVMGSVVYCRSDTENRSQTRFSRYAERCMCRLRRFLYWRAQISRLVDCPAVCACWLCPECPFVRFCDCLPVNPHAVTTDTVCEQPTFAGIIHSFHSGKLTVHSVLCHPV